jgi:hypothetical protein
MTPYEKAKQIYDRQGYDEDAITKLVRYLRSDDEWLDDLLRNEAIRLLQAEMNRSRQATTKRIERQQLERYETSSVTLGPFGGESGSRSFSLSELRQVMDERFGGKSKLRDMTRPQVVEAIATYESQSMGLARNIRVLRAAAKLFTNDTETYLTALKRAEKTGEVAA